MTILQLQKVIGLVLIFTNLGKKWQDYGCFSGTSLLLAVNKNYRIVSVDAIVQQLKDIYLNECEVMRDQWTKLFYPFPEDFEIEKMFLDLEIMEDGRKTGEKSTTMKSSLEAVMKLEKCAGKSFSNEIQGQERPRMSTNWSKIGHGGRNGSMGSSG